MVSDKIPAKIITSDYLFTGIIACNGQRLQEILNNNLTNYLRLHEVQVFRSTDTATEIADFREATIAKAKIDLVLGYNDEHEAPNKRLYAYVPKNRYEVCITVSGCVVRGQLHMPSAPDSYAFLVQEAREFFPLTDATILFASSASQPLQSSVAMVRKAAIALFSIGERV